jgi:protein arginine phosphatase
MAASLLKHLGNGLFDVQSAGIFAAEKQAASFYAKRVLQEEGINIQHESRQVREELVQWSEWVITMTEQHKQVLVHHFPHIQEKVFTLYEFVGEGSRDIADPFGGTEETYRQVYGELKGLIQKML